MARAKMRLRRLDKGKIYRAANASTVRRLLPQQQSPRCLSVLIILDESCSISRDLLETSRENIREAIEVLNKMLDEHLRECDEPDSRCPRHSGRALSGRSAACGGRLW